MAKDLVVFESASADIRAHLDLSAQVLDVGACGARSQHRARLLVAIRGSMLAAMWSPRVAGLRRGLPHPRASAAVIGVARGRARSRGSWGPPTVVFGNVFPDVFLHGETPQPRATRGSFKLSCGSMARCAGAPREAPAKETASQDLRLVGGGEADTRRPCV